MNRPPYPGPSEDRAAIRQTVLHSLKTGPKRLGDVVRAVEGMIIDLAAPPTLSACLQDLAREGRIRLACDGRCWIVSPVPTTSDLHELTRTR